MFYVLRTTRDWPCCSHSIFLCFSIVAIGVEVTMCLSSSRKVASAKAIFVGRSTGCGSTVDGPAKSVHHQLKTVGTTSHDFGWVGGLEHEFYFPQWLG